MKDLWSNLTIEHTRGFIRTRQWAIARSGVIAMMAAIVSYALMPFSILQLILNFVAVFAFLLLVVLFGGKDECRPVKLRTFVKGCLWHLGIVVVLISAKLVWFQSLRIEARERVSEKASPHVLERRRYLLRRVARPDFGPQDIPAFFESPFREELAIATLSMTTLAVTNLAFLSPETQPEAKEAVNSMIEAMLKPAIRRYEVFWWGEDALDSLTGDNGHIGYLGHLNLMLACYVLLGGDPRYDNLFEQISDALARRALNSPSYNVETFPGLIFVADNMPVFASLALRDRVAPVRYREVINLWVSYLKENLLDKELGLLRYNVSLDGKAEGTPRGVMQGWNSMWLPFIDPQFAEDQYARMKRHLTEDLPVLEMAGIREYPRGISGPTDFISWPIVFGVSGPATAFAMGGAHWHNDTEFLNQLLTTAEMVGSTVAFKGERFYLLAPLVGEAIVLAAQTMVNYDDEFIRDKRKNNVKDEVN